MIDHRRQRNDDSATHVEEALCPPLTVVDLKRVAASVTGDYKNFVVLRVNDHCLRVAVMQGKFGWHQHPHSDECFLVLEGELEVDLAGGRTVQLRPEEAFTVPAGVVHRTRARARAVNLCFETQSAYTDVVFDDTPDN
jgi:mannose-6-phosphate isomerase-like protein (cupin superfamily)